MTRSDFATTLRAAVVEAMRRFREYSPAESPYALAVILGQCGNYLGHAIASEEGLRRVAAGYAAKGYRYQCEEWEQIDQLERLATWLRWSNPDDGWRYGDFPDSSGVVAALAELVGTGEFGEDANHLEEFATIVLADLHSDPDWQCLTRGHRVYVGVTHGSDPRNFLRTASRANTHDVARDLWGEYWQGDELRNRILSPYRKR
ncbi:: DUF4303 [Gemmataceae bacterium]|nr:: DUF4303 [Gemmataceae bacterium]VTU00079.1 : DUF4303 [Gemmataceae bacterium]